MGLGPQGLLLQDLVLHTYLALRASCLSSGQTQASFEVRLLRDGVGPVPPLGPLALCLGLTLRDLEKN